MRYNTIPLFDITGTYPMLSADNDNKFPQEVYDNRFKCDHYNHFMQQTQAEIGFIALTNLKLYKGPEKNGTWYLT